jgi:hypothetical protein
MAESIYDYVVERLQANKGSWPVIAKQTGMSIKTITKTANRTYDAPRIDTLETLAAFFRKHPVVIKNNFGGRDRTTMG